jgi:hypothetical protein
MSRNQLHDINVVLLAAVCIVRVVCRGVATTQGGKGAQQHTAARAM